MRRTTSFLVLLAALAAVPGVRAGEVPPYRLDPEVWQRAVVTEVMVAPRDAPAETGQWIELSNLGAEAVNLQGLVLATASGGFHVVSPAQPLVLEPADVAVLGPVAGLNGPVGAGTGYAYGGDLRLDPDSEVMLLLWNGALVDFVTWGPESVTVEPGRSLSLEPPAPDGGGFKEWCPGREPYGDGTDRGTPGLPNPWCDHDGDGAAEDQGDCDDANSSVGPDRAELCNGIDEDCDGLTDEDVPILPVCLSMGVCAVTTARCDGREGWACDYPPAYQEAETLCDGLDNDCDGFADEGLAWEGLALGLPCQAHGTCGAGSVVCSPTTAAATCSTLPDGTEPGGGEETCDGRDDDCDGATDEGFEVGLPCTAGLGACVRTGVRRCEGPRATRCDADAGTSSPEVCGDGVDNDCNGQVDDGFPVGDTCSVGVGACRSVGKLRCAEDGLSVTCLATAGLPAAEVCGNGVDEDCDGTVDEADCLVPAAPGGGGCTASGHPAHGWLPLILLLSWGVALRRTRRRAG